LSQPCRNPGSGAFYVAAFAAGGRPGILTESPRPPLRMAHGLEFVKRRSQPFQSTIVSDEVEME
jgi:hypothetical protein